MQIGNERNQYEELYNAPMLLGVPSFDKASSLGRSFYCREIGYGVMVAVNGGGYEADKAVTFTFQEEPWLGEQTIELKTRDDVPLTADAIISEDSIAKEALGIAIEQAHSIENLREHADELRTLTDAFFTGRQ